MKNRMDRYNNASSLEDIPSRLDKNKNLYDNLYNTIKYAEIIDFENNQPYELENNKVGSATREKYQRLKEYKNLINREYKEEKIRPTIVEEPKIYDINIILEEAKKDRNDSSLSGEDYRQFAEVSGIFKDGKSGEIQELIDTITSKSLRQDLDKKIETEGLLSDLLPDEESETTLLEPLELDGMNNNQNILNNFLQNSKPQIDKTFYTKSLEFSTRDFESSNKGEFIEKRKSSVIVKIFTVISVILIIGALLFVIIKYIL